MTPKEYILSHIWRHECTVESCGSEDRHKGQELWELPSEVFIQACIMHGEPVAPM